MVDLTRGERGTRGTAEIRAAEADAAFQVLGMDFRENARPRRHDVAGHAGKAARRGRVHPPPQAAARAHALDQRPPSRSRRRGPAREAGDVPLPARPISRPKANRTRPCGSCISPRTGWSRATSTWTSPNFYEHKLRAARCYASQFHRPDSTEPKTFISRPEFWADLEARHRYNGYQIGVKYAEAFLVREKLEIDDPMSFFCGK